LRGKAATDYKEASLAQSKPESKKFTPVAKISNPRPITQLSNPASAPCSGSKNLRMSYIASESASHRRYSKYPPNKSSEDLGIIDISSSSADEKPLTSKIKTQPQPSSSTITATGTIDISSSSADERPLTSKIKIQQPSSSSDHRYCYHM